MSDISEFKVDFRDRISRTMFLIKEMLKTSPKLNIVGTTNNAAQATRVAESLKRFGYIDFDNIQTETLIYDGKRQTRLIISVHKTANFDKLYNENEEARKKKKRRDKKRRQKTLIIKLKNIIAS